MVKGEADITRPEKRNQGKANDSIPMTGKIVLVTGANSGIGKETAMDLNRRGAKVYMLCRNQARADEAVRDMVQNGADRSRLIVLIADLSSFASIRAVVADFERREQKLDVLVNNAAVSVLQTYELTGDGHEMTWQCNYLGPFLLTELLLPMLQRSQSARIVIVSSELHKYGSVTEQPELMDDKAQWSVFGPYNNTKLANVMHARELAKRLRQKGITNVTVNSLHPGFVDTNLTKEGSWLLKQAMRPAKALFALKSTDGAKTSIYLSTSAKVEGTSGKYYEKCKEERISSKAQNDAACAKLYDYSLAACGLP